MKLTDQEQVILKAIGSGVAEISHVIRAVGYPKATTKKILVGLLNKGVVSLHRHDWPASLSPADRKLMVKIGSNYYGAVSVREKNPKGKHLRGATAKQQRQYEDILKSAKASGRYKGREKEVAARTVRARAKNKSGKGREALKTTGRALKKAASSVLGAGSQILGAGAKALNPRRRKQNKTTIKAKRVVVLNRATKKATKKRKRNVTRASHPKSLSKTRARASSAGRKAKKTSTRSVVKTRKGATRRASGNPTRRGMRKLYREAKRISKITRGRYFSSESGQRKAARHEKRHARKSRLNPSAESIRKKFAGHVNGERDLFFPQGTPSGKLAKLGKLVSITTEKGTIKPVNGTAWLCADTKGKLHIGSVSGAPLFDGPKRSFGKVSKIEYLDVKKHLGHTRPTIFFHHVGEENGIKPTLATDGKGGLVFKGGAYRITTRGLEN